MRMYVQPTQHDIFGALHAAAERATPTELVALYLDVVALRKHLEVVLDARLTAGEVVTAEGHGSVIKRVGKNRKAWKRDELLTDARRAYLERHPATAVDPATGEQSVHTWADAEDFFTTLWLLGEPRKTPVKALGLRVDDYCETGGKTVSFEVVDNRVAAAGPQPDRVVDLMAKLEESVEAAKAARARKEAEDAQAM